MNKKELQIAKGDFPIFKLEKNFKEDYKIRDKFAKKYTCAWINKKMTKRIYVSEFCHVIEKDLSRLGSIASALAGPNRYGVYL